GAFIGQHWGVGGVAIAVSIAMCINWLTMAALGRSVTGLSWPRFVRAQAPGALFSLVLGAIVAMAVQAARSAHLGKLPTLIAAGLTAGAVTYVVSRLRSEVLLGSHGRWAVARIEDVVRQGSRRIARPRTARDRVAPTAK